MLNFLLDDDWNRMLETELIKFWITLNRKNKYETVIKFR